MRDVVASDGLISLGIDRNWRFERDFRHTNAVPVHAYDGCTDFAYLFRETRRALSVRDWRWTARSLLTVVDYKWFFSGRDVRHFRKFVSTGEYAYQASGAPIVGLPQVFEAMFETGASNLFLKIDIEGAEYVILNELVERASATTGLAIEFHGCDDRIAEIVSFVEHYPLTLVHIHANSYGDLGDRDIPRALELTFSSSARRAAAVPILPHPLDEPNDGGVETPLQFVSLA